MFNLPKIPSGHFDFNLGKFHLPVQYWQAIAVVVLLFFLVMLMAKFRRHYVDWSLKGAVFGVFFGFLLALILEGFLIISGRTAITSLLGWKNPPKAVANVLDTGRNKLIQVLGTSTTIPSSFAKESSSVKDAVDAIQSLSPADVKTVKSIICQ